MSPKPLITQWFPASTIGAESLRDVSAGQQPPPNRLHVWWARRPLTTARAAVLATLLPVWNEEIHESNFLLGDAVVADGNAGSRIPSRASGFKRSTSTVLSSRLVGETSVDSGASRRFGQFASEMEHKFANGGGAVGELLKEWFGTEDRYRKWFQEALGIKGDPVWTRQLIDAAKVTGEHLGQNPYGYKRAFTLSPSPKVIERIRHLSGIRSDNSAGKPPVVLDLFGGGGSIPFEAARYGCRALASELNPVATAVLHGTVTLPFQEGPEFQSVIDSWGQRWCHRIEERLQGFFHHEDSETIRGFIWAHTVPCPTTGHQTPLMPNHWLARTSTQKESVRLTPELDTGVIHITVIHDAAPEEGNRQTYKRGVATSIFTGDAFDGTYISREAQAGRMKHLLLAIAYRPANGKGTLFRTPTVKDIKAIDRAKEYVKMQWDEWDSQGLIPTEYIPRGNKTKEPHRYGMSRWCDIFTPRQLLTVVVALEELHRVLEEATSELREDRLKALNLYLAFALDKVVSYNGRMSRWDASYLKVSQLFDHHNFAFKWTYAEMAGVDACRWGLDQITSCYRDLAKLAAGTDFKTSQSLLEQDALLIPGEPTLASATALPYADKSVDAIVTDPPYYDNVMYAELADYFYVWLKRSLRPYWPELCQQYLSDKDNEAVANKVRFEDLATHSGRGKKPPGTKTAPELATHHYETLMAEAFAEAHRVLRDNGAMTVMFTHKRVEAWNALAKALLQAGFQITSSWPVTTESAHSLHQRGNNSASSTILLTCLKREGKSSAFWHEIQSDVRRVARQAAIGFAKEGLIGVDVTLASFGPALSVLSEKWPVYTGELDANGERQQVAPEYVLDLARQEIARAKLERLLPEGRALDFDSPTNWWLLAWSDFRAAKFPASEALKLSQATHMELETDLRRKYRLVETKSGTAEILIPERRFDSKSFALGFEFAYETWIDRLHALMVTYEHDGLQVARNWLRQTQLADNDKFRTLIEAAIQAIPRPKNNKGEIVIAEAKTLESIRATLFPDIEAPPEPMLGLDQRSLYSS